MGRGGHRGSLAEARPARRRASRGPRHACCAPCGTPRPPSLTPPVPAARPRARRRRATPGPRKPRGPPPPSPSRAVQASDALSAQPCTIARPDRHECPCGDRSTRRSSGVCIYGLRSCPGAIASREPGCVAGARPQIGAADAPRARLCGRGPAVWQGRGRLAGADRAHDDRQRTRKRPKELWEDRPVDSTRLRTSPESRRASLVPRSLALRPSNLAPGPVPSITRRAGLAVRTAPSGKTKCSRRGYAATMALSTNARRMATKLSPTFPPMWTVCGHPSLDGVAILGPSVADTHRYPPEATSCGRSLPGS